MSFQQSADRMLHNRALLGVGLMMLGLALYPLSDAFVKHLMGTYSVCQATLLRAAARLVPLLAATFFHGGPARVLYSEHPSRHLRRLAVNLVYTFSFMIAFSLASLTTVYTFGFTSPFFMIILGALMLKERVTLDRWIAVGVGMAGIVLAVDPDSTILESAALLVLFATFLGALNKIMMRKLASTDHSLAITIYPNCVMIVAIGVLALITYAAPGALPPCLALIWKPMPWSHWGLFAIVGVLTAAAHYAIAQSLRFAQASTLAPIDYSSLLWVMALDYGWWNQAPEDRTLLGAAVIIGSNLYILYRTRKEEAAKKVIAA